MPITSHRHRLARLATAEALDRVRPGPAKRAKRHSAQQATAMIVLRIARTAR
jgi:hypothetical protein